MTITGANFGPSPFVTLDLVPLTLRSATETQIVAAVPISMMPPGNYLLTVSRGPSPAETGSFQLTIGAAKPKPLAAETGSPVARATPAPSGAGAERAAQVGDRVITMAEVDREWQRTDPAGYIALSRQMYEMRRRIADTMAADELLAREAAARGLTVAALLAEEIPKRIITTPDSAVRSLYEGLGDRARGATLEQMRPALRAWLQRITEPELAKMTYIEELMKVSTRAENFLVAPRVAVERTRAGCRTRTRDGAGRTGRVRRFPEHRVRQVRARVRPRARDVWRSPAPGGQEPADAGFIVGGRG